MSLSLGRRLGVEMTDDPPFLQRVRRLAITSGVALGVVWILAVATLEAGPAIETGLLLGWLSMPTVLAISLRRPRIRRWVAVPALLVTASLVALCLGSLPASGPERAGWLVLAAGILMGGAIGLWFWYRLLPVPEILRDPFGSARWILIAIHVGLVVCGIALILLPVLT